jgi:micrococcal nuclease
MIRRIRTFLVLLAALPCGGALLIACSVQVGRLAPLDRVTPASRDARWATVVYVIDGDTIIITLDGRQTRVRLLGIDAPEDTGRHNCFGEQATAELRRLLPHGSAVLLAHDQRRIDPYGRDLTYVWRSDGAFVNRILVRRGFATTLVIPPNVRYQQELNRAEELARRERAGLWRSCAVRT